MKMYRCYDGSWINLEKAYEFKVTVEYNFEGKQETEYSVRAYFPIPITIDKDMISPDFSILALFDTKDEAQVMLDTLILDRFGREL
jgi:hypothetical protein